MTDSAQKMGFRIMIHELKNNELCTGGQIRSSLGDHLFLMM
jgi:hypothetical protein